MSSQYTGIVASTSLNLRVPNTSDINNYDTYLDVCRLMRAYVDNVSDTASDMASRGIEYHSFGVSGWSGGETIAPMLWSIGNLSNFFSRFSKARTGLVMTSFYEPIIASDFLETVYTNNATSHEIYNRVTNHEPVSNIVPLSWNTLTTSIPEIDLAHIAIFNLVDDRITQSIVNALSSGGILIVANSSNGGEIYDTTKPTSFAQDVHDYIHSLRDFSSFHFQGYISYTVFICN